MNTVIPAPAVTIVIINWNYARFVADAIQSVKDQTYGNVQCLVIDNGSKDESAAVIETAIAGHSHFTFHRLPDNLGQLDAGVWALDHVTSEFVTFLDADDFLFPDYVLLHLQAQLSGTTPVAFSSSGCVQVDGSRHLISGSTGSFQKAWSDAQPFLLPVERAARMPGIDAANYVALAAATRYRPKSQRGWGWSPGSANMFRRSLLMRLRPSPASLKAVGVLDGYFMPVLHALSGSMLINQPLSAYRLHGGNDFVGFPAVPNLRGMSTAHWARHDAVVRRSLASLIDGFADHIFWPHELWGLLDAVSEYSSSPGAFGQDDVKAAFVRQYPALVRAFGERAFLSELRNRMSFDACRDIVWRARSGAPWATSWRRLATLELRQKMRRRTSR